MMSGANVRRKGQIKQTFKPVDLSNSVYVHGSISKSGPQERVAEQYSHNISKYQILLYSNEYERVIVRVVACLVLMLNQIEHTT